MFRSTRFSKNRLVIHDLLRRIQHDHGPVSGAFQWDVTTLLERLEAERAKGRSIGLASYMVKVTAEVLKIHPKLNARLFRRWNGPHLVEWDEISCNLIVSRVGSDGEEKLFPIVIRNADSTPIEEIHERIRDLKQKPLDQLPQVRTQQLIRRLPRAAMKMVDHLIRTKPDFYIKRFGTYGLSCLIQYETGASGGSAMSPSTTFYPTSIDERPMVVDGEIAIRKVMLYGLVVDHYVVDGLSAVRAAMSLRKWVENPDLLLGPFQP